MTIIKKLAMAGSVAAFALATPAFAAPYTAPSATGTATVRLYDAITLDKVTDVDFGVVIRDAAYAGGSSIAMDATGATDCATVVGLSCTGATSAGEFTLKGDNGSAMTVSVSSADFDPVTSVLTLHNGSDSLALTLSFGGMTQNTDPVSGDGTNDFSVTGTGANQTLSVYGDLEIKASADAANGVYTSSYNLTADYN